MWNMLIAGGVERGRGCRPAELVSTARGPLVPVAAVMILVYFAVSLMLGIDDDERRVAKSFLRPTSVAV